MSGDASLGEIAHTPAFWAAYRRDLPVYGVGAALAGYLIEARGLPVLKDIFRESHDEDDDLAALIERRTGLPLEAIEARIGEWLPVAVA